MSWTYSQSAGCLDRPNGGTIGFGFAGNGPGLNNPDQQNIHDIGPLPRGKYTMVAYIDKHPTMGLCVIQLAPDPANAMYGRSGFFIHGSRSLLTSGLKLYLESSDGCICIGDCALRESIWQSGDRQLIVVP